MSVRILVLRSRRFELIWPEHVLDRLKKLGEVTIQEEPIPRADPDSSERLAAYIKNVKPDVLIIGWGVPVLPLAVIDDNPRLKLIHHPAGTVRDYFQREFLARKDAPPITNWGDTIAPAVAEAALMMTLAGLRRVAAAQMELHVRKGWDGVPPAESLYDRPVACHGLGAIAREYVRLLKPFRCPVAAYSPHVPDEVFAELGVRRVDSLEELYGTHRIIACHAGSTPENYHIVNKEILARVPAGGLLVNTARGEVLDTEALVAELKSGRLHAALDVYEPEPLPKESPLRGLENCLLMPHTGGPTPDWLYRMGETAVRNVEHLVRGEELENVVSLRVFDRST